MELLLGRHGCAEEPYRVARDEDRTLTIAGREQVRAVARGIAAAGQIPSLILTSPLVRAVQTAELMSSIWSNSETRIHVHVERALAPGGDYATLVAALKKFENKRIAAVGHEPDTSDRAARLVGPAAEMLCARARGNGFLPGMLVGMTIDVERAITDPHNPAGVANFVVNPLGGHVIMA